MFNMQIAVIKEDKMSFQNKSNIYSSLAIRTMYLYAMAASLAFILIGCASPQDQHIDTLLSKLDKAHAALIKYKGNPSGVTEVNGQGLTGKRSLAVDAAIKTKDFFDSLSLVKYTTARDIQEMQGYEAWATDATGRLREKADTCLKLVREIKEEYKQNTNNFEYMAQLRLSNIPSQRYPLLWLAKDNYLTFALGDGNGVPVEMILMVDFRASLDSLRNQGKSKEKSGSN
jgi:hypothetical protein